MRKLAVVVALLAAACSRGPRLSRSAEGAPVLEIRGAVKDGPYKLGRADIERLPRTAVRGVDPASGREAVWEGPSLAAVTGRIEIAKGADTAIVRTADRAAIPIPLTVIRQRKPVLADRADGVRLDARVLAWPTVEQRGLETDPRASAWWAKDIVAIELADWQRTFGPALATPDGALDAARHGSALYGERCISCHRMRGAGGERGPDLTTVAARLRPRPFADLLERHPGWSVTGGEPPGPEAADELWSFLTAVAKAGPARPEPLTADTAPGQASAP